MSRKRKTNKTVQDINTIPEGGNGLVFVGFPRERFMIPEFIDNRDQILVNLTKAGRACGYHNANGHRVDKNRDGIVESFLKDEREPEWLLQLDTDMEHPVDLVETLIKHRKPIIGGLYFHRNLQHDPFVFRRIQDMPDKYGRNAPHWAPMRSLVYDFITKSGLPMADGSFHVLNPPFDPLIECDAVATGALLVHRSVFLNMQPPWFEYRDNAISEDLMFCKMAKDIGYKIYCDISVMSGHYTLTPVGQAEFRTMYESMSVEATKFTKEQAIDDIASYFSIPQEEAKDVIDNGSAAVVGSYWNEVQPKTDEEVAAFYRDEKTGKLYIVELMYWNMSDGFTRMRSSLTKIRGANILEIGAGIGTIACQLAIQMNNVMAVEPNDTTRGFMQRRVKEMVETPGMECTTPVIIGKEDWWTVVPDESQDFVIAFDVYEHIPLAELREIIKHAAKKLKKGGRMLYHNNFGQQDLYPMHFNHSEDWSKVMEEAGMQELSPLEAVKK